MIKQTSKAMKKTLENYSFFLCNKSVHFRLFSSKHQFSKLATPKNSMVCILLILISFSLNTNAQTTLTWSGNGSDSNWNTANNWSGVAPVAANILNFAGNTRLINNNNITAGTIFNGLAFASNASSFTLKGNSIGLNGTISNNSSSLQTINTPIVLSANTSLNATSGNLLLNGQISGLYGITNAGNTTTLGGINTYTGSTTISTGTLALRGGHNSIATNKDMVINGGALDLGTYNQYIGALSGTGGVIDGTGLLTINESSAQTYAGSIGNSNALNMTKLGSSILTLTGTNSTTGTINILGGTSVAASGGGTGINLSGSGTLLSATNINIRNGTLILDNTSINSTDRINDAAAISLDGGAITFKGLAGNTSTETLGAVTLNTGMSNILVSAGSSIGTAKLNLTSLVRNQGATLNLQRLNTQSYQSGVSLGKTGAFPNILVSSTPGSTGGVTPTTVNGIVPGVFSGERDLVGYVDGLGFGNLGTSGFPSYTTCNGTSTLLSSASTTSNVFASGALAVKSGGQTINAVNMRANNLTFANASDVLTLTSGMLMTQGTGGPRLIGTTSLPGVLTSSANELFLFSWNNSGGIITMNSKLTGSNMVVFGGDGNGSSVSLIPTNTSNDYTGGTVINQGASGGAILNLNNSGGVAVIPNATIPSNGLILNNATCNMSISAGQIGSGNIVTLNGGAVFTLYGNNTLAGLVFNSNGGNNTPTVSPTGTLTISGGITSNPSNLAVVPSISGGTLDLNGQSGFTMNINAYSEGITNNLSPIGLTISSVIQNGGITKTGTGILSLTNASNTFTGNTTINAGQLVFNTSTSSSFTSPIVLNGGGLSTNGIGANNVITSSSTLSLTDNSTIILNNNSHTIKFAASNNTSWTSGKKLIIYGWTGTAGASGTGGKIFFGSNASGLSQTQLNQISFDGFAAAVATLLSTGELVPRTVTTPSITTAPTASTITYGQTLASSILSGGVASVAGTFAFTTPSTAPDAGTANQGYTFTPTDAANYNTVTGTVSVKVNKATPYITSVPTATAITYGQTLASSTLSGGVASVAGTFAFTTTSTAPDAGITNQDYTFTPTDATNYNSVTGTVSVKVNKATPSITTAPTASAITYGQTLASSTLNGGIASVTGTFAFNTPSTAPGVGTASQGYTFTPTDNTNYNSVTGNVSVSVVLPSFTYNFSGNKAFRDLGAVLTNVNTNQFNSSKVYAYTNGTWAAYSGIMTPGKGYRILVDGTATPTITTTGDAVLTGNQSPTLSGGSNKFSFIANPYQAQVDFTAVSKSGLYNGFWYFNPKQFVDGYLQYNYYGSNLGASNIYSGNAASQYLQAGQGFFVCSNTSGTPSFTFTEASKYTGAAPISVFGVSAPLNRIATGLFKNGSNIDGAVTVFNNSFYNSMASEDGLKMNNAGENLTFTVAGNDLCANGWSMPSATDQLPMHLYNLTPNTAYTIKLDASQFNGNGLSAYIQDNVLNTKTLLTGINNEVTFTTGSDVTTDASRYIIVFGASPLPVKSISLTATILSNSQVSVKWTTVGESNIASYKVERSVNGVSFTELVTVNAGASSYSYIDAKLSSGFVAYYRIKIIDNAGAVSYSKVATLTTNHSPLTTISVYPNPVVNNTFNLSIANAGKYTVSLVDALGKTVYTTTVNHTTAATLESIALTSKLAAGSYMLKAVDENGNASATQVIIK